MFDPYLIKKRGEYQFTKTLDRYFKGKIDNYYKTSCNICNKFFIA